jgi:hypothetical protein
MKKFIFTESQIKKIIKSQVNEGTLSPNVSKASSTVRKAPSIRDDKSTIKKLRTQKVKLVILGFTSKVTNSDLYNKKYKRPTVVGSIAGIPIDEKSKGKLFDNDTLITLDNGATLIFGVVGVDKTYAEANGGLSLSNKNGKIQLNYEWD